MKALVLATDDLKAELQAYPINGGLELVWITQSGLPIDYPPADTCIDLLFKNEQQHIQWLKQLPVSFIIINSVITSLAELKENFIRINGWNTFLKRDTVEAACNDEELKVKAEELFTHLGRKTEWVADIPGFISPRVVASIINEAFITLEEKISVENEIDVAMKLGTNYPYGPFEWGQKIGLHHVYSLLETLGREQVRYKPSALLKERSLV